MGYKDLREERSKENKVEENRLLEDLRAVEVKACINPYSGGVLVMRNGVLVRELRAVG